MPHDTRPPSPSTYRVLLEGGADPNSVDEDRDTPLHYACSSGNVDIITMLLAKGADPTAADGLGRTPAERSTGTGVQQLLEAESYKCEFLWWLLLWLLLAISAVLSRFPALLCVCHPSIYINTLWRSMSATLTRLPFLPRSSAHLASFHIIFFHDSAAIPKNIAQIRKQTEALQLRVDTNESIFVQKAIAIKGLRIAIEDKDAEIRGLKRKVRNFWFHHRNCEGRL